MEDAAKTLVQLESMHEFFNARSLKMAERLSVELNLTVDTRDTADGSPFYSMSCPIRYDGMRYDQLVKLQQLIAQFGVQISALGMEELKVKTAAANAKT